VSVFRLVRFLDRKGLRLDLVDGKLHYAAEGEPPGPKVLKILKRHRPELLRALELREEPLARLVAQLADCGVWPALLENGVPCLRMHAGARPEDVDRDVVDALQERAGELAAWLRRPPGPEDLEALGYDRGLCDGRSDGK